MSNVSPRLLSAIVEAKARLEECEDELRSAESERDEAHCDLERLQADYAEATGSPYQEGDEEVELMTDEAKAERAAHQRWLAHILRTYLWNRVSMPIRIRIENMGGAIRDDDPLPTESLLILETEFRQHARHLWHRNAQ